MIHFHWGCVRVGPGLFFCCRLFLRLSKPAGEHGKNVPACSVIWEPGVGGVSCRLSSRSGWFRLLSSEDSIFWLTECKEGRFFEGDGAPEKRWGQRNLFTPSRSSLSTREDAQQLPMGGKFPFFTKTTLDPHLVVIYTWQASKQWLSYSELVPYLQSPMCQKDAALLSWGHHTAIIRDLPHAS